MFDSVRQAFALLPDARRVRNFFLRNSRTGEEVLAAQGVECSPGERRYTFATVPPESRPDLLPVPLADQSAVDEYLERFLKGARDGRSVVLLQMLVAASSAEENPIAVDEFPA